MDQSDREESKKTKKEPSRVCKILPTFMKRNQDKNLLENSRIPLKKSILQIFGYGLRKNLGQRSVIME